ncbi:ribonucleoside-diphosphate reductase subunit alpha [Planctomyces sp. SH-PL14]|uniref:ribonucleoside-diphosphate reductase subunit alpha n=1 Tax=Planctomyces sp. SH-PL14 TaxID=1632864 RepID=UPI00078E4104|nr:ribonucleoside-diphosphate reductase subunit alpha [Planctomyces sp. SH-PL14]AMV16709.1 Ribonucleoside-diphosphate reductase 1 subunit alpha [Planctomyces sp. SH-PL14]
MLRAPHEWVVRKRDGRVVSFDLARIQNAIANAFRAELNLAAGQPLDADVQQEIADVARSVGDDIGVAASRPEGIDVERIQDLVEMGLMACGQYRVARRYIIYRSEHAKMRLIRGEVPVADETPVVHVVLPDGTRVPFDPQRARKRIAEACRGFETIVSVDELVDEVIRSVFDGIALAEVYRVQILAARSRIERDPAFDVVASRLMRNVIYQEVLGETPEARSLTAVHRDQFEHSIIDGIRAGRLAPELRSFDLGRLAVAMKPERDDQFRYLGLQAIYDRYLLHIGGRRIETPQFFWMRVAMGLAIQEPEDREARAIEFYEVLSTFRFTSATPTLFNSATPHPQLSSCYLSTVDDDLEHIFKVVSDNAKLSKWAGGLGNDWTRIRATNSHIHGTNGKSQGVIPFLKVVNDAAVAVNQGGKRKGAVCSYLETWHLDVEEFLDLRKNTGDERRRTHDMHTANWIPDLFLQRVRQNGSWTLFSPDEVPDLHDLYGRAFQERYEHYERLADGGEIPLFRRLPAAELWRKMLTRLFETGHPWITFKDPSNIRSPQDHVGVVHSSNLCTEILLNTSAQETAVCNLGSINLKAHVVDGRFDLELLADTVRTAVRMLDNVVDINFYPTPEAERSNRRHRPVGLGIMGFQDALQALGISYASDAAVEFSDRSMEAIAYHAISASADLARERGAYATYAGSKWDRGLLPLDTLDLLEQNRGEAIQVDRSSALDWQPVREAIAAHGMRNSNVLAIAPTATISTIIGVTQSIEPAYKYLYVKSNLSGEFTQVSDVLVDELKRLDLWDAQMLEEIKYYDGSIQNIGRIPLEIRRRYLTAFELEPKWLIECASRRQKWIDQGQSLNLYLAEPSGRKMHDMYFLAWDKGLKTTYYLRTLAATQVEKSTVDVNRFGIQPKWMKNKSASSEVEVRRDGGSAESNSLEAAVPQAGAMCPIDDPGCESCQ